MWKNYWLAIALVLIAFGHGGACESGKGFPERSLVSAIVSYLERQR